MKNRILMTLVALFCLSGCGREDVKINCVDEVLESQAMIPYQGQDIECRFFLSLYEYEEEQYFLLGNNCADMVVYPFGCEGNELCSSTDECTDFYESARYIGIVGVERE